MLKGVPVRLFQNTSESMPRSGSIHGQIKVEFADGTGQYVACRLVHLDQENMRILVFADIDGEKRNGWIPQSWCYSAFIIQKTEIQKMRVVRTRFRIGRFPLTAPRLDYFGASSGNLVEEIEIPVVITKNLSPDDLQEIARL